VKGHTRLNKLLDGILEGHDLALPLHRLEGDDVLQDFPEYIIHGLKIK
jgi:hypothetical protein